MATATKSIPFVVPAQHLPAEPITQFELGALLSLNARLAQLKSQVESAEESIIARLRAGAAVEPGPRTAEVKRNLRRTPSWKNIARRLAKRLGLDPDQYYGNVIAHTKPSENFSLEIG